jgi:hypothetical protein
LLLSAFLKFLFLALTLEKQRGKEYISTGFFHLCSILILQKYNRAMFQALGYKIAKTGAVNAMY